MDELIKQFQKPEWWISVVVVGLLINIISDYLKPTLDSFFARFSSKVRQTSERQKLVFESDVQNLINNPEQLTSLKLETLRLNIRAILLIVVCLMLDKLPMMPFPYSFIFLFQSNSEVALPLRLFLAILGLFSFIPLIYALANLNRERYINQVIKSYEKRVNIIQSSVVP